MNEAAENKMKNEEIKNREMKNKEMINAEITNPRVLNTEVSNTEVSNTEVSNTETAENMTAMLEERYDLAMERIRQIPEEHFGEPAFEKYFAFVAEFLILLDETRTFLAEGGLEKASVEELASRNHALYADILPEHYEASYGNPGYAVKELGEEFGALLSYLYAKIRRNIGSIYDGELEEQVIRLELFVQVYTAFLYEWQESGRLPEKEAIRQINYWSVCDYAEEAALVTIKGRLSPQDSLGVKIIQNSDLTDIRYLYAYGEYVSGNEVETARFLAGLDEETIATMADTYTEGYRLGFEVTGKDLSRKKIVNILYKLGFERMMRRAVQNFEKLGLKCTASRVYGFTGGDVNRQYEYDHKNDQAVYLDKNYINRQLEATRSAYERYKQEAAWCAGPAVVETFGEKDFDPESKQAAIKLTDEQNRLWVEYRSQAGMLSREYIPQEERSFTIIAFPVPEIGPVFQELFWETIRINTLDYMLYRNVQQKLIDALDQADYCEIKGMGDNRTDLKVNLWKLSDPSKETIFENCVADVNIPVGEVFTSPVLQGTNGVLHVTKVFLNGLEYRNLSVTFQDGMISDYDCSNFDDPEENKRFLKENVLFRRETLPLGEFAIGTNTTAYVAAKRLGVEAKLPILIAEKMGPHFAVGDTCYAHAEDVKVYNPDGKEIVARENEMAARRGENPLEAYFNCHTDITIPYDELGELTAVCKDGSRIVIIKEGRFVLPGTEPLNEPFNG